MKSSALSRTETGTLFQSSPSTLLGFASVFSVGVGLRAHDVGRSLWNDEAWVANSVLTDTVSRMFHYEAWLQTSPPLFLVLVRIAVRIFGLSNYVLRAVPFVLSILALVLFAELCCRIFPKPLALLATTSFAISPIAIVASKELKQYSSDLAAAVIVMLVVWNYWRKADLRAWCFLCATCAVALGLSYTAVVFIPLAVAAILARPVDPTISCQRARRFVIFVGTLLAISGLEDFLLIRPNRSDQLEHFWSHGFPTGSVAGIAHFYGHEFIKMGIFYFLPEGWIHAIFDFLSGWLMLGVIATCLMLGTLVAVAVARKATYVHIAALAVVPAVTLGILNLAGLYPMGYLRLTLFMLPSIVIAWTLAVEIIWSTVLEPLSPKWIRNRPVGVAWVLAAAILIAPMPIRDWADNRKEIEDAKSAILYLKSHVAADDLVYVHASASETSKLYFRMLRWEPQRLSYGHTGYPCCTRLGGLATAPPDENRFKQDFDNVIRKAGAKNLWLVFTGRDEHWGYLHRNEEQILTGRLKAVGCGNGVRINFTEEVLYEYTCETH
jgi:hypothetical protein